MKDSRITRRDDDNHVVFVRHYRRVNELVSPISAWGCGSLSSSITPDHLILIVPGLPFVVPLLLVLLLLLLLWLLLLLLLLLLLRVQSSIVRGVLHLLLLPQDVLLLKNWDVKKWVISY
jgi:hypothetical protein